MKMKIQNQPSGNMERTADSIGQNLSTITAASAPWSR